MTKYANITKHRINEILELYNNCNISKSISNGEIIKDTNVDICLPTRQQRLALSMLCTLEDILAYLCSKLQDNQHDMTIDNIKKLTFEIVNKIASCEKIIKTHQAIRSQKYREIVKLAFKLTDKYKFDNSSIKQAIINNNNFFMSNSKSHLGQFNKKWHHMPQIDNKLNKQT